MSDFSRFRDGDEYYDVKDAKAREDLSKKADTESPAFTGTPTVPTAVSGTSTGQIASTEYVMNESKKIKESVGNVSAVDPTTVEDPVSPYMTKAETKTYLDSKGYQTANDVTNTINSKITISTGDPEGGSDGDLWFKYEE